MKIIYNKIYLTQNKTPTMLGYESERRLKNLLVAVGDGERDIEAAR